MKATLEFNLPEDQVDFNMATKASDAHLALWEVSQEVFRPARKHGYPDPVIEAALAACNGCGEELIYLLEQKFYEILNERNIELNQ